MKTDDVDKQTYSYTAWLYKMRIDFAILGVVTNVGQILMYHFVCMNTQKFIKHS